MNSTFDLFLVVFLAVLLAFLVIAATVAFVICGGMEVARSAAKRLLPKMAQPFVQLGYLLLAFLYLLVGRKAAQVFFVILLTAAVGYINKAGFNNWLWIIVTVMTGLTLASLLAGGNGKPSAMDKLLEERPSLKSGPILLRLVRTIRG